MCNFHLSSFYSLCLQRKLVHIAKTGKPKSHSPNYLLLFGVRKKKKTEKKKNHPKPKKHLQTQDWNTQGKAEKH